MDKFRYLSIGDRSVGEGGLMQAETYDRIRKNKSEGTTSQTYDRIRAPGTMGPTYDRKRSEEGAENAINW